MVAAELSLQIALGGLDQTSLQKDELLLAAQGVALASNARASQDTASFSS